MIHSVSPQKIPSYSTDTRPNKAILFFIVIVAALGGVLFGYDTGIISSALLSIGAEFHLGDFGKELVTSAILIGGILGALGSGPVSDRIGRKRTVLIVAFLFMIGAVSTGMVPDAASLVATRFLLGVAVGAVTQIMPVYIAELVPAPRRGGMVVLFQVMIAGGEVLSYLIGYGLSGHWRLMFVLAAIPGLILFCGMFFLPESPRWLVMRRQKDSAFAILARLRGSQVQARQEVARIEAVNQEKKGTWSDLNKPWARPALIAAVGVSAFCQLTGINAVIYYAPTILTQAGFGDAAALIATIGVGVVLLVMNLIGTFLVDYWGRRQLMLIMIPLSVIALFALGAALWGGHPTGSAKWVVVISMLAYIAFNGGSLSVVIWLLNSEVIPLSVRGLGTGLAAVAMWVSDLIVSLTALSLIAFMGASGVFWLYGVISILALIFVYYCVPETKGRTLEEIEQSLKEGCFAPYVAMRSPRQS